MQRSIRFYFDYISPFAYLAWSRLESFAQAHDVVFEPVPVLFAGLLNAHGQLGPVEIESKARWLFQHVPRQAARHHIEINPPAFHPFNPLLALRVTGLSMSPENRWELIEQLFRAVWVEARHLSDPGVVAEICDRLGFDGRKMITDAGSPEGKNELRKQTEAAISDGVFGVPTWRVDDARFWGFDDLENLACYLDVGEPEGASSWKELPKASSARIP